MMSEIRFKYVMGLMNTALSSVKGCQTTIKQNDELFSLCNDLFQNIQLSREPTPEAISQTSSEA